MCEKMKVGRLDDYTEGNGVEKRGDKSSGTQQDGRRLWAFLVRYRVKKAKQVMKTKFETCNKDLKFRSSIKEYEYNHKVKTWNGVKTYQLLRGEISWNKRKVWMNLYVDGQEFKRIIYPVGQQFSNENLILSRLILLPNNLFRHQQVPFRCVP